MDDGYSFFCGSVPILLLLRHGGGPGPIWQLLAGCIGGIVAYRVFGAHFQAAGALMPIFLISVTGGAFVGLLVNAVLGMRGGLQTRATN